MRSKKSNSAAVIFRRAILVSTFLALSCACEVLADPLNFMVGPLTFNRPPDWKWKDPDPSTKASAELQIVDLTTQKEAQVLMSVSSAEPDDVLKRWKSYFSEPPSIDWQTTTNHVQLYSITYLTVTGTQRSKKKEPRPDYSLLGAVIQTEKGTVYGRLLGPRKMVEGLKSEFKKMVETAVTEN